MSRIDEALSLTEGQARRARGDQQQAFEPAWQVSAREQHEPEQETSVFSAALGKLPVPDGVIRFSSEWKERLATGPDADPGLTEQFRRLAATLHHAKQANGLREVMVTSAVPGDGKTLTAVNLAFVLAESYRYRVLLIDADLRRPSIPSLGDLTIGSGLSEVLTAQTEQKLAVVPVTSRLTLLPAGRPISNSIEALTSPRMRMIFEEARSRFDWVILDAPPVGAATDARLLAQLVGGTLFVVHAGQTQCPEVQQAIDAVGREQILGVVLNGMRGMKGEAYVYGADAKT